MASDWVDIRLGDVCTKIGSGATPRGGSGVYLESGEVTLIRSQNVYNDGFRHDGLVFLTEQHANGLSNVELQESDVLLNITGDSVARACQVDPKVLPARVNQHVAIIRPDPKHLSPLYLRYFLVSPHMQSHMMSLAGAGATRNALTKGMIEGFRIFAPLDVREQQAIACILGALDDKIELNRRRNETLEGIARALFQSWFVDFEPVHAKAAGRTLPGLKPELVALFPDSFEDSMLGVIPKGWSVKTVSDVTFRVTKGDTPRAEALKAASNNDRWIPMLRVNAITDDGEIHIEKAERIPESIHFGKSKRSILEPNDILYTNAGTIGRVAFVQPELLPANTNQAIAIVKPNPACVPPGYLFMTLRRPEFQAELHKDIVQAVQANLALGKISEAKFIIPPMHSIQVLFDPTNAILNQVWHAREHSRTIAALRDTLLPKLISGELQVPDAERIVGRAI
jgi:type I restriction enzyme S subunit